MGQVLELHDSVAEALGYSDYEDGAHEDENPYRFGTLNHENWLSGWDQAFHHYRREREMDEQDANELRKYK